MSGCTAPKRGHRTAGGAARCPVHGGRSISGFSQSRGLSGASTPPTLRSDEVVRGLVQAGLDAATSEAFTGVLVDVAVTLSEEASARGKPGHWLCVMLADAADGLDSPEEYGAYQDEQDCTGGRWGDTEGRFHIGGHSIGLGE